MWWPAGRAAVSAGRRPLSRTARNGPEPLTQARRSYRSSFRYSLATSHDTLRGNPASTLSLCEGMEERDRAAASGWWHIGLGRDACTLRRRSHVQEGQPPVRVIVREPYGADAVSEPVECPVQCAMAAPVYRSQPSDHLGVRDHRATLRRYG